MLYKTNKISREDAYILLSEKLDIPISTCHIAWFDIDMCYKAARAAREIFFDLHGGVS